MSTLYLSKYLKAGKEMKEQKQLNLTNPEAIKRAITVH